MFPRTGKDVQQNSTKSTSLPQESLRISKERSPKTPASGSRSGRGDGVQEHL